MELDLPQGLKLEVDDAPPGAALWAGGGGLCPALAEVSLRGGSLSPAALQKLAEGLSGGHGAADSEGLTLDLHGVLALALTMRPSDAPLVGDAIATLIQHAPLVAEIDVGACPLGVAGVEPIARALAGNKSLSHLGVAAVGLGLDGARRPSVDGAKRLAAALRANGDLLSLDIRHNGLTQEGLRLIRSAIAARPRSHNTTHKEQLNLRFEPQDPLPPGQLIPRSPRDEYDDEDGFAA